MVYPICGHFQSDTDTPLITAPPNFPPTSKTNLGMTPDLISNLVPQQQPQLTMNVNVDDTVNVSHLNLNLLDANDPTASILLPSLPLPLPHDLQLGFPEERLFDDVNADAAFGIHTGEFGGHSAATSIATLPGVFNRGSASSLDQSQQPWSLLQPGSNEGAAQLMDTSGSVDDEIEFIDTAPDTDTTGFFLSSASATTSNTTTPTTPTTPTTNPYRLQPLENKSLTELASEFGFELTNFDPACVYQHDTEFQQLLSAFWHHPNLETPKILPDSRSERSLVLPQVKPTNADLLSLPAFGINPSTNPNNRNTNTKSVALRPKRRWDGCELTAAARALKDSNFSSASSSSLPPSSTTSLTLSSSCSCSTSSLSCSCVCSYSSVDDINQKSVTIIEEDDIDEESFTINTNTNTVNTDTVNTNVADCLDITEEELREFIESTSLDLSSSTPPTTSSLSSSSSSLSSSSATATGTSSESSLSIPSPSLTTTKQSLTSRYTKFLTLRPHEIAECIRAFAAHELAHIDFKLLSKLMQRAGFSSQQIRDLKAMRKTFKNRESAIKTLEKRRSRLSYATGMNKKLSQMVRCLHTRNKILTRQNTHLQHQQTVARDEGSHCGTECDRLKHKITQLSARVLELSPHQN